jgi:DNA invertase Pin-like site-specific DNA recombinase
VRVSDRNRNRLVPRELLERSLIVERVKAGMRRARLEGRHIGRRSLDIDRQAVKRDRTNGRSLTEIAKTHNISRATVCRVLKQEDAYEQQSA